MGEVVPIIRDSQEIWDQIAADCAAAAAARRHRRTENFRHHTVPLILLVGILGAAGTGIVYGVKTINVSNEVPTCGIGVAEDGDGAQVVVDNAAAEAKVGTVDNYRSAVADVMDLGEIHPNYRYALWFRDGGVYVNDSAVAVNGLDTTCADLTPPAIPQN